MKEGAALQVVHAVVVDLLVLQKTQRLLILNHYKLLTDLVPLREANTYLNGEVTNCRQPVSLTSTPILHHMIFRVIYLHSHHCVRVILGRAVLGHRRCGHREVTKEWAVKTLASLCHSKWWCVTRHVLHSVTVTVCSSCLLLLSVTMSVKVCTARCYNKGYVRWLSNCVTLYVTVCSNCAIVCCHIDADVLSCVLLLHVAPLDLPPRYQWNVSWHYI